MHLFIEDFFNEQGCLTIFPWFIQDDEGEHLHILGIVVLILIIIGIIGGIILFIFVIARFFKTPTGLNNPEFPDVPADPTLHTGRNDKVHPEDGPDSRGDRDNEDGRHTERKISFDSGPTLIRERSSTHERRRSSDQKEPNHGRRSSGAREESPTRKGRRSSGHRETSPPDQAPRSSGQKETSPPRHMRRSSAQKETPPPRQGRRKSVQRERSPSSHTIYANKTLL